MLILHSGLQTFVHSNPTVIQVAYDLSQDPSYLRDHHNWPFMVIELWIVPIRLGCWQVLLITKVVEISPNLAMHLWDPE